jgi:thiol:disulfide interchange protein DsbA
LLDRMMENSYMKRTLSKRVFSAWFLFLCLTVGAAGQSLAATPPYRQIVPPQPTEVAPGKIEVVEIFWYGCGHCYAFEPELKAWLAKMPKDVQFRRVPGVLNPSWEVHGRAYFAAQELGVLEQIHSALFAAIHKENRTLNDKETLAAFYAEQGVDQQRFIEAFDSFGVDTRTKQANAAVVAYGVHGVPALIVNGKYNIAPGDGGFPAMLKTLDILIDQERAKAKK